MRNKFNCTIQARYVFTENNQVYLKRSTSEIEGTISNGNDDEWSPINFQWIPVFELNKELNYQII